MFIHCIIKSLLALDDEMERLHKCTDLFSSCSKKQFDHRNPGEQVLLILLLILGRAAYNFKMQYSGRLKNLLCKYSIIYYCDSLQTSHAILDQKLDQSASRCGPLQIFYVLFLSEVRLSHLQLCHSLMSHLNREQETVV